MSAPDPSPPGAERHNGLTADTYGALVDLDPRLAESVLDALAAAGVAAYVVPSAHREPTTRAAVLPPRPLSRLWVDTRHAGSARSVVAAEAAALGPGHFHAVPRLGDRIVLPPPALPPTDTDAAFDEIVAGLLADGGVPGAPQGPGAPTGPADLPRPTGTTPPAPPTRPRVVRAEDDGLPGWLEPDALEEEETEREESGFVPPPPPPVGPIAWRTLLSVAGVVLGLLLAFAPGVLGQTGTTGVSLLGLGLLCGGATGLVLAVRDTSPWDRGPDDGAVV